jgi:hypothetical protein
MLSRLHAAASGPVAREEVRKASEKKGSSVNDLVP